jgi:ABC-2 type transport system permease protein
MSGRRVAALVRRLVAEIRRDRPSLALLFIAPILITGLITYILRESDRPAVHAVVVAPSGPAGTSIGAAVSSALTAQGATVATAPDEETARTMIANGDATVAIVIPATLAGTQPPTFTIVTNGLDPSGEGAQVAAATRALAAAAASSSGAQAPTIEHETLYGAPGSDPISPYAPALVGFFIYFFVYLLTGVSFLRERTGGTLERLMATPVAQPEIVTGYTLGFGLFAIAQVAILMCWVLGTIHVPAVGPLPAFAIGLGVPISGSPLVAYIVVVVLALGAVSLGIFLSTFARTELQVIQFIPIVLVPQFLLSGVLFPVSSLPEIVRFFVPFMPLSYAVNALRHVFIAGAGLDSPDVQLDLLVLAGFAVFFGAIASLTIRREVA